MLKKFLAGLTAIVLSLGMVALTAAPASAHSNNISAQVACSTDPQGFWKVTWTIQNDHGADATINTSTRTAIPTPTVIPANSSMQFVEYFASKPGSHVELEINSTWAGDNYNRDNDHSINKNKFSDDCVPDDTDKKVDVCHYDNGQGGKYTLNDISVNSVLNGSSHAGNSGTHGPDIIPPFDYIDHGVPGHFSGKNWDAYGQAVYAAGCDKPSVTPAAPTFTEAVCTAPGQSGQASYVIPSTTGVVYSVRINNAGNFVETAANTYYVAQGTKVEVQATASPGYKLQGTTEWSKTFAVFDCIVKATPTEPTFTEAVCTAPGQSGDASYVIPSTTGVVYSVRINNAGGFVETAANTYYVAPGTKVEVTAAPATGYTLEGTTEWSTTFLVLDCIVKTNPATPTFDSAECLVDQPGGYGTASYTIPSTTGVQYQVRFGVVGSWTDKAAGTYPIAANGYVQVRAVALTGYTLEGTVKWTKDFKKPDCLTDVTPTKPTKTQAVCTGEEQVGSASFEIPNIPGVKYQELVNWSWVDRAPGSHPAADGSLVTLRAVPLPGFELTDPDLLSHNKIFLLYFDNLVADKDCIMPQEPTFDPQECVGLGLTSQASYTVPSDTGVKYEIWDGANWVPIAAGTYDVNSFPTTVSIRAVEKHGYHFLDGSTTEWSEEFVAAEDCGELPDLPVVDPVVTFTQTTCAVSGSYTLGVEQPGLEAGVIWTVSGGLPNTLGKHSVNTAGTVMITATPAAGYGFPGLEPVLEWEYEFATLPDDCLPTLALTGGGTALGALGLSAVLTLGGILLIGARRRDDAMGAQG